MVRSFEFTESEINYTLLTIPREWNYSLGNYCVSSEQVTDPLCIDSNGNKIIFVTSNMIAKVTELESTNLEAKRLLLKHKF